MTSALHLAAHQYVPRTLPLRGKRPIPMDWPNWRATRATIDAHWSRDPHTNVGIRTGGGFVALDVDPRAGGDDVLADLEHEHGELPATVEVVTGGGGRHFYFRGPVDLPSYDVGAGLEIKAAGRQVVAPPSVHPDTGALYQWRDGHAPGQIRRADLPAWLMAGRGSQGRPQAAPADTWTALLRGGLAEGGRNTGMARLVGHLLAKNVDAHLVAEIAHLVAAHRCRPALDACETDRIVTSIASRELRKRGGAS
jgi:hypothetical protein